jgi:hypothetical protein
VQGVDDGRHCSQLHRHRGVSANSVSTVDTAAALGFQQAQNCNLLIKARGQMMWFWRSAADTSWGVFMKALGSVYDGHYQCMWPPHALAGYVIEQKCQSDSVQLGKIQVEMD